MPFDPDYPSSHDSRQDPAQTGEAPRMKAHREPANPTEAWAARAIVTVAGLDPDGARVRNGEGFSATDTDLGSSLAAQIVTYGPRLSERQWPLVVRIATRYRGQVDEPMPSMLIPVPPAESPDVQRVRAEMARAELLLDALLAADPGQPLTLERSRQLGNPRRGGHPELRGTVGERCVAVGCTTEAGETFRTYQCQRCPYGPSGARTVQASRVCRGIAYIALRRAWLLEAEGRADEAWEIRETMGLAEGRADEASDGCGSR